MMMRLLKLIRNQFHLLQNILVSLLLLNTWNFWLIVLIGSKDVGSTIKSPKGKKFVGGSSDFDFVKVFDNDGSSDTF